MKVPKQFQEKFIEVLAQHIAEKVVTYIFSEGGKYIERTIEKGRQYDIMIGNTSGWKNESGDIQSIEIHVHSWGEI